MKEMTEKLRAKNNEIKDMESVYEKKLAELQESNRKLLKHNTLLNANSDETKEIVRLVASGYGAGNILEVLTKEKGMNVSLDQIHVTMDKIDLLPDNLYRFFLQCKQDFKDKVSIDSGFFTNIIYKKFTLLENETSAQLARAKEMGDEKLILQCVQQLASLYDKMSATFAKNGLDLTQDKTVEDLMGDYDKNKNESSVIKFSKEKVRKV